MHQHEHERPSRANELHVLVHSGLKAHFDSAQSPLRMLCSGLDRIAFVDDGDLIAPRRSIDLPVLIPVTSEYQAEGLRAVRVRHPLSLLIAVTNDVSGFRTYYAIRSGASFVFNLAIPGESQVDMLYAQFRSHRTSNSVDTAATWLQSVPVDQETRHDGLEHSAPHHSAGQAVTRLAEEERCPDLTPATRQPLRAEGTTPAQPAVSEDDTALMRLMCSSMTVSEIARRYYCSERSMYRRIRKLYDTIGVASRNEMMSLASVLGLNQPQPAQAARLPAQRDRQRGHAPDRRHAS